MEKSKYLKIHTIQKIKSFETRLTKIERIECQELATCNPELPIKEVIKGYRNGSIYTYTSVTLDSIEDLRMYHGIDLRGEYKALYEK